MTPPRLRGAALVAARMAAENGTTAAALGGVLKQSLGIDRLKALPDSVRGSLPLDTTPVRARTAHELPSADAAHASETKPESARAWPRTSADLRAAFESKRVDPAALAERATTFVAALATERDGALNILQASDLERTRREARASAERIAAGRPLGPLDGVPFLVKDELDVAGLPRLLGSRCESSEPRPTDATVVARLSAAGAVFVGKTVMTEWGMSPLGQNARFSMPHNAHHEERLPGGSSSGSGVGVALGVVPLAIGVDGGGSVRIPAALNGVFGIKPTFARISNAGAGLAGSVGHIGPLGASVADLAIFLDAVASAPDPRDPFTSLAPPPPRGGFGARLAAGVRGLTIGVIPSEWADAAEDVAAAGKSALAALERAGAKLVDVSLPLAAVAAPIGYLTIGCESFASHVDHWRERRQRMGDDLRLSYAVLSGISAADFLDAQRLRAALRLELAEVLRTVDVLGLPTTQTTAPHLSRVERGQALADPTAIDAMCRFNFLGNLTGAPAVTAPVGVDRDGLPIGLQILGDAWDEHVVLGVAAHLERIGVAEVRRPRITSLDLLG
ncbi:MAG: amidase [Polyangiaceae bacterium]